MYEKNKRKLFYYVNISAKPASKYPHYFLNTPRIGIKRTKELQALCSIAASLTSLAGTSTSYTRINNESHICIPRGDISPARCDGWLEEMELIFALHKCNGRPWPSVDDPARDTSILYRSRRAIVRTIEPLVYTTLQIYFCSSIRSDSQRDSTPSLCPI